MEPMVENKKESHASLWGAIVVIVILLILGGIFIYSEVEKNQRENKALRNALENREPITIIVDEGTVKAQ